MAETTATENTSKPAKAKNTVAARQARYGATATLYTLVVIAVLIVINWLGQMPRFNKTFDTTSNKRFTLSQETQKIIKGLNTDATITYIDKGSNFDQAKGILDRYKNLSPKIHIQYINYEKQPTVARAYGLRFPGTAYVEIGQRREEAKALTEEGITGAFVKDLKGVRKVCFINGSGERRLDDTQETGLSAFKTLLQRDNYEADSVTLLDKTAVPSDCTVLVIAGPQANYTANEVTAIKNYVEGGGRALVLLDPPLDFGREHIAPNTALVDLLKTWGVTEDNDLVLEQNPIGQLFNIGPEIPLITSYESQPIVNDLKEATGLPITRSLDVKNGDKTTVEKLFSTTNQAIATSHLDTPDFEKYQDKKGPFVLGAAVTYNTGKPNSSGRAVVIGTSGFLDNGTIGFQGNRDLALNTVNWLSSDEDLISIRPKEPEDRRLNVNQRQMSSFLYFDIFAVPLLLIIGGVVIFLKRR
ncbi:MAG: GldG family protein [Acidobacteriaceae bacterium]|nr:GldG family protein [Acidobacteriaceae bacterium]